MSLDGKVSSYLPVWDDSKVEVIARGAIQIKSRGSETVVNTARETARDRVSPSERDSSTWPRSPTWGRTPSRGPTTHFTTA